MQFFSASIEMGMIDTGNMTQWLRALTALAEDLGLIPSPSMVTLNLFLPPWATGIPVVHRCIFRQNTHTHAIVLKVFKDTNICFSLFLINYFF